MCHWAEWLFPVICGRRNSSSVKEPLCLFPLSFPALVWRTTLRSSACPINQHFRRATNLFLTAGMAPLTLMSPCLSNNTGWSFTRTVFVLIDWKKRDELLKLNRSLWMLRRCWGWETWLGSRAHQTDTQRHGFWWESVPTQLRTQALWNKLWHKTQDGCL